MTLRITIHLIELAKLLSKLLPSDSNTVSILLFFRDKPALNGYFLCSFDMVTGDHSDLHLKCWMELLRFNFSILDFLDCLANILSDWII